MKAYGGSEGRGPRAISARGKGVWLTSLPSCFTPGRRDALRIAYEPGWTQSLSGRFVEDTSPYRELNHNYPVLQPLAVSLHRLSYPGSCKENRLEILAVIQFRIFRARFFCPKSAALKINLLRQCSTFE